MEKNKPEEFKKPDINLLGLGNYFKEFLMLFLAVFCGYLAEDFRESHQEKAKAEELARRFYYELKEDSIAMEKVIQLRLRREAAFRYLRDYFRDSSLTNTSKQFSIQYTYGMILFTPTLFDPQDVILEQIRSGGTLEYFKDPEIQNLTGKLVSVMTKLRKRNDAETESNTKRIAEINQKHGDPDWLLALAQYNGPISDTLKTYELSPEVRPFHLQNMETLDRALIRNAIGGNLVALISTRKLTYGNYQKVNDDLLKRLRVVYHL